MDKFLDNFWYVIKIYLEIILDNTDILGLNEIEIIWIANANVKNKLKFCNEIQLNI